MVNRRVQRKPGAAERRIRSLAPDAKTRQEAVATVVADLMHDVDCPPTDLDHLGQKLGVREVALEQLPGSGELHKTKTGYRIVCSTDQPVSRQRFTVAHELAHIILETSGRNAPRSGIEVERICDSLAAECLMPTSVFLRFLPDRIVAADISRLAEIFTTSRTATAIRCAELRSLTVFAVSGDRITWGYGGIRRGALANLPDQIQHAVTAAMAGESPPEQVCLYTPRSTRVKLRRFDWLRAGKENTIFLLLPVYAGSGSGL